MIKNCSKWLGRKETNKEEYPINLTCGQNSVQQLNDFPNVIKMIAQSDALMNHNSKMNTYCHIMYGLIANTDIKKGFAEAHN